MNVLHVSGHAGWGGSEQQIIYLIDELIQYGVRQKVFCFLETPLYNKLQEKPVEVFAIEKVKPYKSDYRKFLLKIIKDQKIDLIHLHTGDAVTGYVLTDALHSLEIPTVYSRKLIRNNDSFLSRLKYNYKNIDKIICVSQIVQEEFKKSLKKKNHFKLAIVPDGVKVEDSAKEAPYKLRETLGISKETTLIGNIANHSKAKDLKTLIKTINHLVNDLGVKNFHLIQMGETGKRTEEYQDLMKQFKLEPYFSFMGFTENASSFLPQFDIFTMSSEREGGPSSVIESIYHKTPVVSTRVGIVPELIKNGENGFSVEVGDYKTLAKYLCKLIEEPELRSTFSQRSYQFFLENFTADKLGKNTYKIYQEILKN